MADRRTTGLAVGAGMAAALLWAGYYVFLLGLPEKANYLILEVPFLAAGLLFLVPLPGSGSAGPARVLRLAVSPGGLLRGALLMTLQVDVIIATRWAGAVDASLATLLADVVATPLLVFAFYRADAKRVRAPAFWVGVAIASLGAAVTIFAGGSTSPLTLASGLVLVPLPFVIAIYFVLVNEACKKAPSPDVLGAASLTSCLVGIPPILLLVGPSVLLVPLSALQWGILVVIGLTAFYIAPWMYFWAAAKTSIVIPAVLQALIPVFTLLMVALLGLQAVTPIAWVGVPIAFVGSVIAVVELPKRAGKLDPG